MTMFTVKLSSEINRSGCPTPYLSDDLKISLVQVPCRWSRESITIRFHVLVFGYSPSLTTAQNMRIGPHDNKLDNRWRF
jgi:hypothetical protein